MTFIFIIRLRLEVFGFFWSACKKKVERILCLTLKDGNVEKGPFEDATQKS